MIPEPALLVLVRHGHTAGNDAGRRVRMSGRTDLPLSPLGRRQAEVLSAALRAGPRAAAVHASPLARALDTARGLAGPHLGPLRLAPDLQEIDCGEVDGLPVGEVEERYPDLWRANRRQDDPGFRWPGGESYAELRARILAALSRIAGAHAGERVVVVTHAGVIAQALGFLHDVGPERWERFRPGNCSLTEVWWRQGSGRLVRFDERSHLCDVEERASAAAEERVSAAAERPAGVGAPDDAQAVARRP